MSKYHQYAERFADSVLLQIVGDENPELRKLMKEWAVKVTPTFRLYRSGELVDTTTGTGSSKLENAILSKLVEGERGQDWAEVTHEDMALSQEEAEKK